MAAYMGEEEVIQKNMALAQEVFYTTKDLELLPEDTRAELIDGRLYYMATPSSSHQQMVTFLVGNIWSHTKKNKGTCKVYPSPFAVYLNSDNLTCLEPDVTVVCDPGRVDERGCHGAPDFVAEVVSPSSRSRDYLLKLTRYQAAGVREYWIVDLERKIVMVYAFEEGKVFSYGLDDQIPLGIMEGLVIDFSEFTLNIF